MEMRVIFEQMPASESLEQRIKDKLIKIADRYSWVIAAEVFLKQEKLNEEAQSKCRVKLSVPGTYLFAETVTDNFEKAATESLSKIERQLKKKKETMTV